MTDSFVKIELSKKPSSGKIEKIISGSLEMQNLVLKNFSVAMGRARPTPLIEVDHRFPYFYSECINASGELLGSFVFDQKSGTIVANTAKQISWEWKRG